MSLVAASQRILLKTSGKYVGRRAILPLPLVVSKTVRCVRVLHVLLRDG
jgi:hypothetical protein